MIASFAGGRITGTGKWVQLVLLQYFVFMMLTAASTYAESTARVSYISFLSSVSINDDHDPASEVAYSTLLLADDSPNVLIDLPFRFMLSGLAVDRLFASPNGALHYSPVQPCPEINTFAGLGCGIDTSYHNVIAGFLVDLNPSNSSDCNIVSYLSNAGSVFSVAYRNVVYYGTQQYNSFRIALYRNDSRIVFAYDSINTENGRPNNAGAGGFLSGLRSPQDDLYTYYDDTQNAFEMSELGYGIKGVYAPVNSVRTGGQFNICPMSRAWCLQPTVLSMNSSADISEASPVYSYDTVTLSSLLLACADQLEFGLLLSTSEQYYNATNSSEGYVAHLPCDAEYDPLNATEGVEIRCNSSIVFAAMPDYEGLLYAWPTWKPLNGNFTGSSTVFNTTSTSSDSSSATYLTTVSASSAETIDSFQCSECFSVIQVDGLSITIERSKISTSASTCSSSTPIANFTDSCDTCSICEAAFSCVGTDCVSAETGSSSTAVSLEWYAVESCDGQCPIDTADAAGSYYRDATGTCCRYSNMDCSGRCNSSSIISLNVEGSAYCCPHYEQEIDCTGVCGSTEVVEDVCGECGGNDLTGIGCFNFTQVILTSGVEDNTYFPVFDVSQAPSTLIIEYYFNISNLSNLSVQIDLVDLSVNADTGDPSRLGPVVLFPQQSEVLESGTVDAQFSFQVSLQEVYSDERDGWESKVVLVQYASTANPSAQYGYFLTVNPASTNCDTLSNTDRCRRLPGCMLCVKYPGVRILEEMETLQQEGANRHIYPYIYPYPAGYGIDPHFIKGTAAAFELPQHRPTIGKYPAHPGLPGHVAVSDNIAYGEAAATPRSGRGQQQQEKGEEGFIRRSLFTEFFPFYIQDDDEELIDGECYNGWFLEDCPVNFVNSAAAATGSMNICCSTTMTLLSLATLAMTIVLLL